MMPTVSAICSISDRMWEETMIVTPSWRARVTMSWRISATPAGSSPLVGSSRSMRAGFDSSAMASPRRCFMPME